MSNMQNEKQNKIYRKKYHYTKSQVKSLILENAALCDEVAKIQENIQIVKEERRYLLRKLSEFQKRADLVIAYYSQPQEPLNISNGPRTKPKKRRSFEEVSKNA